RGRLRGEEGPDGEARLRRGQQRTARRHARRGRARLLRARRGELRPQAFRWLAERGGFEPPEQVNPAQQVSNLARSATPAPLRGARGGKPATGCQATDYHVRCVAYGRPSGRAGRVA